MPWQPANSWGGGSVGALIAELVIRGPIPGGAAWERPGENSLTGPKRATRRLINSRTVQFDRSQPWRVMDYEFDVAQRGGGGLLASVCVRGDFLRALALWGKVRAS